MTADLILHNGLFTTLDRSNPNATAVAIKDGLFMEVARMPRSWRLQAPKRRSSI